MNIKFSLILACLAIVMALMTTAQAQDEEVNLYSARIEALIKPLLDRFTDATGIKVNLVTADADAMIQRLQSEGRNSPADLIITVDAGRLHRAREAGVLQPIKSEKLESLIPAAYRDPEGYWFGLSVRARPIMYALDRVDPKELSTYEDLSAEKWQGRICLRSSNSIYNQSLTASMIAADGLKATEATVDSWINNLSIPPRGADMDQIKAVAAGLCDVTLANTYYLGKMLQSDQKSEVAAAEKVGIFWPNQQDRGTHVNISGAGVTVSAKHKENALKLMAFMVNDESQKWYAETNDEYPVRPEVPESALLKSWGEFKADDLNLARLGELNSDALKLMDRAGWR